MTDQMTDRQTEVEHRRTIEIQEKRNEGKPAKRNEISITFVCRW